MKRKLIISILSLMILLLGGCGQDNTNTNEPPAESPSATPVATEAPQSTATPVATEASQPTATPQNNTVGGNDSQTEMISEEEAKLIALNHMGLTNDQVTFIKSGIDWDNGRKNYDVEFYTHDYKEYDYEIDPYSGTILDYDYDAEYYPSDSATHEEEHITEDEAKQIALEQVSDATLQDIRKFKSEYDNGKLIYEGKIYYDQKEYEFEIDGNTGTILEWDVEPIYG